MTTPHRPMPLDLAALLTLGLTIQALALTLPITRTGALAITGLALTQVALGAWIVRTLELNHHERHHSTAWPPPTHTHHPESSNR